MYHIKKRIYDIFGDFSKPSIGAIKPALTKFEKADYLKVRKTLSDGGKLTCHYSITSNGKKALKNMLMEDLSDNPIQFKNNSAIKIIISEILPKEQQLALLKDISRKIELHKIEAEKKLNSQLKFNQKILIDNLILEYDNFLKLIDKLGK